MRRCSPCLLCSDFPALTSFSCLTWIRSRSTQNSWRESFRFWMQMKWELPCQLMETRTFSLLSKTRFEFMASLSWRTRQWLTCSLWLITLNILYLRSASLSTSSSQRLIDQTLDGWEECRFWGHRFQSHPHWISSRMWFSRSSRSRRLNAEILTLVLSNCFLRMRSALCLRSASCLEAEKVFSHRRRRASHGTDRSKALEWLF